MIKLLSLFSGIGAFEKALQNLGIEFDLVNYCEIDKYASKSYSLIHNVSEDLNLKDVTKVNTDLLPKDLDLITYGYPCQDISIAGKQKGFTDENGQRTRSGLFFEALRIIKDTKPKFAIAENVKALTSKKFEKEFNIVLDSLDNAGYNNYYKILNSKDFGIPQNRERIFIISIRKDIDDGNFTFPNPFKLDLRLKDILENNVEEKYYLKESKNYFMKHSFEEELKGNGFRFSPHIKDNADISKAITTRAGDRMDDNFILDNKVDTNETNFVFSSKNKNLINNNTKSKCVKLFDLHDTDKVKYQSGSIYDSNYISPALSTMQGGHSKPFIIDNTQGFDGVKTYDNYAPTLTTRPEGFKTANLIVEKTDKTICLNSKGGRNGVNGLQPSLQDRVYSSDGISTAVTTSYMPNITEPKIIRDEPLKIEGWHRNATEVLNSNGLCRTLSTQSNNLCTKVTDPMNYRIRKLTPTECWRLMGFTDDDINKCIAGGLSNAQLYKQAGNSIVVNVLHFILKNLFKVQ